MRTGVLPPELDVDVDFCCVENPMELERIVDVVELERMVLAPTGGLVLPSNWVSTATERIATVMTSMTKVDRFPAGLTTLF
jgi:hypothetical protein